MRFSKFFLLVPTVFVILIITGFFIIPLIALLTTGFFTYVPGSTRPLHVFTWDNYLRCFSPTYAGVFLDTLRISVVSTIIGLLLAYPLAYHAVKSSNSFIRKFLIAITMVIFCTSLIVKCYSYVSFLGRSGVMNQLLNFLGFGMIEFLGTENGLIICIIHQIIPFAVLCLFGSIKSVDNSLIEGAKSLGASSVQTFFKITLPLTIPGIISASILTFLGSVSTFTTVIIVGKGKVQMIASYIFNRFQETMNYPFASALSGVLLILTFVISYGITKILTKFIKVK